MGYWAGSFFWERVRFFLLESWGTWLYDIGAEFVGGASRGGEGSPPFPHGLWLYG